MKRLLMFTVLGMLSLGATAQTETEIQSGPPSEVQVHGIQIVLPAKPYRIWQTDFDSYKGGYDLSNGETMVLFSRGRRMYATVGDRPRTELVAAKSNVFVAVDTQFKMTLAHEGDEVTGEVLLKVPGSAAADAQGGETVRLLARR